MMVMVTIGSAFPRERVEFNPSSGSSGSADSDIFGAEFSAFATGAEKGCRLPGYGMKRIGSFVL
jgi:hypothetical protein